MTTTNRYRAGGPPPLQLHRAQPVDFVMSDEEEQEVRNGYDMAMKAVLPERDVETVEEYETDAMAIAWVGWLLVACALVVIFSGLGYLAGRYFS